METNVPFLEIRRTDEGVPTNASVGVLGIIFKAGSTGSFECECQECLEKQRMPTLSGALHWFAYHADSCPGPAPETVSGREG